MPQNLHWFHIQSSLLLRNSRSSKCREIKMLNDKEIRSCLRVRKLFCTLKLLPLEVNVEQRSFTLQNSVWKRLLAHLLYCHLLFRALFALFRVLHGLFFGLYSKNEPHLLTWDVVMLLSSAMYGSWYAMFFMWRSGNTIHMLNQAYSVNNYLTTGNEAEEINCNFWNRLWSAIKLVSAGESETNRLIQDPLRHTRQELIVLWLPHSFFLALPFCISAYVYEPRFKTVPISLMEEPSLTVMIVWIIEEFWFLLSLLTMCIYGTTTHALCFEKLLGIIKSVRANAINCK